MDKPKTKLRRTRKTFRITALFPFDVVFTGLDSSDCKPGLAGIVISIIKKEDLEMRNFMKSRSGMELVQVAILVAIAVALGLIFKTQITDFVNRTFEGLNDFA